MWCEICLRKCRRKESVKQFFRNTGYKFIFSTRFPMLFFILQHFSYSYLFDFVRNRLALLCICDCWRMVSFSFSTVFVLSSIWLHNLIEFLTICSFSLPLPLSFRSLSALSLSLSLSSNVYSIFRIRHFLLLLVFCENRFPLEDLLTKNGCRGKRGDWDWNGNWKKAITNYFLRNCSRYVRCACMHMYEDAVLIGFRIAPRFAYILIGNNKHFITINDVFDFWRNKHKNDTCNTRWFFFFFNFVSEYLIMRECKRAILSTRRKLNDSYWRIIIIKREINQKK